jgi:hypothetical protein
MKNKLKKRVKDADFLQLAEFIAQLLTEGDFRNCYLYEYSDKDAITLDDAFCVAGVSDGAIKETVQELREAHERGELKKVKEEWYVGIGENAEPSYGLLTDSFGGVIERDIENTIKKLAKKYKIKEKK